MNDFSLLTSNVTHDDVIHFGVRTQGDFDVPVIVR